MSFPLTTRSIENNVRGIFAALFSSQLASILSSQSYKLTTAQIVEDG